MILGGRICNFKGLVRKSSLRINMVDKTIKIKFENALNPSSAFDLIRLEDLFRREGLLHDPETLHRVEFFILLFITEGQGYHTIDFTEFELSRGSLLTIRKDQIHKFSKSENIKGFILLFTNDFLVSYLEQQESHKTLQLFNELLTVPKIQLTKQIYIEVHEIVERIRAEYFQEMDEYSLGIIRSELHILITKLYRVKSKDNQILVSKKYLSSFINFQKLVEEHVSNTTRVTDYARMMAVSTKTLNTISKNIVKQTAKEFIDDVSITQIKRLLINTSLNVNEIAYASGFDEPSNLYKYFKRNVGLTPEEFRSSF